MAKKTEQPTTKQPPVAMSRFDAATRAIGELKEPTTMTALNQAADTLYANAGGKSDPKATLWSTRQAIKAAKAFGLITVRTAEVVISPAKRPNPLKPSVRGWYRPPRTAIRLGIGANRESGTMTKHIAIYVRVSSNLQDTKSQEPELERWAEPKASRSNGIATRRPAKRWTDQDGTS